eukprot:gnl/MRDRNA2_/MRDRNA2_75714_c0_seq1.p1 gnl/MRDRNA2_/MRDRNA2_75714_c0~~gnl/MRDRNA2_/MRDRNA2_75714_c0_seq1.p1  ORF type:complete len:647 (-),score=150.43 gnl/MRDRNA2_/MRDRNA2_75714_c0_seq1:220-2160(-)
MRRVAAVALGGATPPADEAIIRTLRLNVEQEDDCAVAQQLALALAHVTRGDVATVAALLQMLQENNWKTRRNVAAALGWPAAAGDRFAILDKIKENKKKDNTSVAEMAQRALGKLASGDNNTIASVHRLLDSDDEKTRKIAVDALAGLAKHGDMALTSTFMHLIDTEGNNSVAEAAHAALAKVAHGNQTVIAGYIRRLENENNETRKKAADTLGKLADKGDQAVISALISRVKKEDNGTVADEMGGTLRQLVSEGDTTTIRTLIIMLSEEKGKARQVAANVLGWTVPHGDAGVTQALMSRIEYEDDNLAAEALVQALWKVAHGDWPSISTLIGMLESENCNVRRNVVAALGGLAPFGDQAAIRALMPRIEQEDNSTVADNVVLALGRVARNDPDTIATLIGLLQGESLLQRKAAAAALGWVAPYGHPAVINALMKRIQQEEEAEVSQAVVLALAEVAYGDKSTITTLLRLLEEDKNVKVRRNACGGLGGTGVHADEVITNALMQNVKKENNISVVEWAGWALGKVTYGDNATVATLLSWLIDDNEKMRRNAASALGGAAKKGNDVVIANLMLRIEREDAASVIKAASKALKKIHHSDEKFADALMKWMLDNDKKKRENAVAALSSVGPSSSSTHPCIPGRKYPCSK